MEAKNRSWEKLDDQAVKVVLAAQNESRRLGHKSLDTEQILLALLLVEKDGLAGQLLNDLGLKQSDLRQKILELRGRGQEFVGVETPFSESVQKLLEHAGAAAEAEGRRQIAPLHLLYGFVHVQDGVSGRILAEAGISSQALQARLDALKA